MKIYKGIFQTHHVFLKIKFISKQSKLALTRGPTKDEAMSHCTLLIVTVEIERERELRSINSIKFGVIVNKDSAFIPYPEKKNKKKRRK